MSVLALKSKFWCYTLNNYTDEEYKAVTSTPSTYHVCAKEVGEGGTPHLQGYIEFSVRRKGSVVKNLPGFSRVHLERRKGTSEQAAAYCKKSDESPFEEGVRSVSAQGKRSDLDKAIELVKAGGKRKALWDEYPKVMIRYEKSMCRAIEMLGPQVERPVFDLATYPFDLVEFDWAFSHVLWGDSGVGKTSYARSVLPGALLVSHIDDLLRFDADMHRGIIFDDMDFNHIPRTGQIHLVDQDDPRSIHCRYNVAHIPAGTQKIFTSNEIGGRIFDLNDAAVMRRVKIHHIIKN